MPVYRPAASSILRSFRASGKRHLLLTGGRGSGKTTLLRALMPSLCPDAPMLLTAAVPGRWVEMRDTAAGAAAVIGRFDAALPPGENRMRPVADGFLLLGVPALHRMAAGESEWAVLDELGYLENSCPEFRQAVEALLDAKRVLAIVRKQDTPFLTALCARQDAFVVDLDPFGFRVVFQQFKIAVRLDFVLHFFKCTSRFADAAGTIVYEVSGGSIYRSAALMAEDDRLFHSLEFALNSIIAVARPANHLFILLL